MDIGQKPINCSSDLGKEAVAEEQLQSQCSNTRNVPGGALLVRGSDADAELDIPEIFKPQEVANADMK